MTDPFFSGWLVPKRSLLDSRRDTTRPGTNSSSWRVIDGPPRSIPLPALRGPRRLMSRPERTPRIAGSRSPQVLILSNELDVSVDWVVRLLRARGVDYVRLNTERADCWNWSLHPACGRGRVEVAGEDHDLSALTGVWYRRPETPNPSWSNVHPAELELAKAQWRAVFVGLLSVGSASWINEPFRNIAAETKPLQLRIAAEAGFSVPETVVTNSRAEALAFLRAGGQAVVKALSSPLVELADELPLFIYTERAEAKILESAREQEPIPFILQQRVDPKTDVRVTVVDDQVFAAAVADSRIALDWRRLSPPAQFIQYELPRQVADCCRELVRRMGLRFGALDLAVDVEDRHFFLEINPNGEWGWLQKTCDLPIAEAIADALTRTSA